MLGITNVFELPCTRKFLERLTCLVTFFIVGRLVDNIEFFSKYVDVFQGGIAEAPPSQV